MFLKHVYASSDVMRRERDNVLFFMSVFRIGGC